MSFTEVQDTDRLLLVQLNYRSLLNACQVDAYLNSICRDDHFWMLKVNHDFGPEVLKWKPSSETFRQQYDYLYWVVDPVYAVAAGRLDALIVLEQRGILPNDYGANLAARAGHLHVLEWLEKRDILPDEGGADEAAREGHLHVLEWLAQRNILPAVRSANRAAGKGQIQVLEWLAKKGILPTVWAANEAAREGNLDVLNWLAERGIYPQ